MDPTLLLWKSEGQSFFQRFGLWFNHLLDPTLLLFSDAEIQKAHGALLEQNVNVKEKVRNFSLFTKSSVHADSGALLPLHFRPPAVFPASVFPVLGSLIHHNGVRPALFWQFLLQSYNAMFTHTNRNSSGEQEGKSSLLQLLPVIGAVSYTTVAGVLPQILINRLNIKSSLLQTYVKSILPIPLSATLAFFSVLTVRSEESRTGIRVFDSNGNAIGVSKAAGKKAVWDTALSRAVLLGTTAAVPIPLILLLRRTRLFQRNPLLVTPCFYASIALVFCLMIPVSFSLFPQLGTINREKVEDELQAEAVGGELYYHRGL
ncbi:transcript variant X1 [Nothobranchius furzeri]|uniref:Transcript variant X1 n=1 Tax=Nothobranchius furzeri TaxID=105023 RepID=A0A9D2YGY1_NOTFU|nr:transcript variant X1 [Nothobranchius furzeri]